MQIVVLTMQNEPAYARAALSAGALGYVLKESADAELVDAVQAAAEGERKLVGVGRALACRPSLLLLDEPAAGLDTDETLALGRRLRTLPDHGVTVLLIDHDMGLVLSVCDHVMVLDFGNLIAQGTPAEIRANPAVIEAYLGSSEAGGHAAEGDHA